MKMTKTVLEKTAILEEAKIQKKVGSPKKYVAEFFGTMALVLLGCGSVVLAGSAISLAMLASGKLGVKDTFGYIVSQCIGAITVAGILFVIALGKPGYTLAS